MFNEDMRKYKPFSLSIRIYENKGCVNQAMNQRGTVTCMEKLFTATYLCIDNARCFLFVMKCPINEAKDDIEQ